MPEVRLSLEEYIALTEELARLKGVPRRSSVATAQVRAIGARKRKGKPLRGMKGAMKKAHARAKKKDGTFRKGWDQKRLMSYAHKIRGKR